MKNENRILFMLNKVWYWGIIVLRGLVSICISVFLFRLCKGIIIGSRFINLGIMLNLMRFLVFIWRNNRFFFLMFWWVFDFLFLLVRFVVVVVFLFFFRLDGVLNLRYC